MADPETCCRPSIDAAPSDACESILVFCAGQMKVCDHAIQSPERNWEACDMWSFAILLWELSTREVPFAELSAMEQLKNHVPSVVMIIDNTRSRICREIPLEVILHR